MSAEQKMDPIVEAWLKGSSGTPYDTRQGVSRVMARARRTHQRGRWWPLSSFQRAPEEAPTDKTSDHQPTPIPATNGHTPTVLGRTQTMFGPATAVAAGAVFFTLGGVLLIAQPFDRQGGHPPGASTDMEAAAPVWVTGTLSLAPSCTGPTREIAEAEDVVRERDYRCDPQSWETSDPRLTGAATSMWNADVYRMDAMSVSVRAGTYVVRNDQGSWLCHHSNVAPGSGLYAFPDLGETVTCLGDGAYEGLSAVLELDWSSTSPVKIQGLIFAAEAPSFPEPSASD